MNYEIPRSRPAERIMTQSDNLSVLYLLKIGFRHKLLFLIVLCAPVLLAMIGISLSTTTYQATTSMLIDPNRGLQAAAANDQPAAQEQFIKTQVALARSDSVMEQAIHEIGMDKLLGGYKNSPSPGEAYDELGKKIIRENIRASLDPGTYILSLSFSNPNRDAVAKFVNELARAFILKRSEIYSNPEAVSFYKSREAAAESALRVAAAEMLTFSKQTGAFSISEQIRLALARRDTLLTDLAKTQGAARKAEAQLESVRLQLSALKARVTLPPEIYGQLEPGSRKEPSRPNDILSSDPPLLHVKLYQEIAAKLVEANADVAGLRALEGQQKQGLSVTDSELRSLSAQQAEFYRLRQGVDQAEKDLASYKSKASEAEANNSWLRNNSLSGVKIIQRADRPLFPNFPRPRLMLAAGTLSGLVASIAILLLLATRRIRQDDVNRGSIGQISS